MGKGDRDAPALRQTRDVDQHVHVKIVKIFTEKTKRVWLFLPIEKENEKLHGHTKEFEALST